MDKGRQQLIGSIEKLINYSLYLTDEPVVVRVPFEDGTEYSYALEPVNNVVSPTVYRVDDCHGAGKCCMVPFDLIYTQSQWQEVLDYVENWEEPKTASTPPALRENIDLIDRATHITLDVNGNEVPLHILENRAIQEFSKTTSCPYLKYYDDRFWCGIHWFKPLHCMMPHMVVRRNEKRNTAFVGTMQYGRNWKFGCPVVFPDIDMAKYSSSGQEARNRDKMNRMIQMSEDLGVKTAHRRLLQEMDETVELSRLRGSPINLFEQVEDENPCGKCGLV